MNWQVIILLMKHCLYYMCLFLVVTGIGLSASAIVVADYSVAINSPTGDWDLNWDYVYNYKNSSSVAVGSHWLLTAAHVGDDGGGGTIVIDGVSYLQQEVIFHAASDDPEHSNKVDLALVRFDKPFPDYYPLYSSGFPTHPASSKLSVVMVGYGRTGTVYSAYYIPSIYGNGIKRWGTQRVDGDLNLTYNGGGSVGIVTNVVGFKMDFMSSDTAYEAGVAVYDSGGGTFVKEGGVWKLAGINTVIYRAYSSTPSNAVDRTFSVSVLAYETWITQKIDSITGDADSDGIPNWWEEQYVTNVLASTDQDDDGFTGEEEYIADTDPTDSNSFWQVEGVITSADQTFTFEGSTARQYQLLYTTNGLTDPGLTWITNGAPVWGEGVGSEMVITNTENMVFYRMQAILP